MLITIKRAAGTRSRQRFFWVLLRCWHLGQEHQVRYSARRRESRVLRLQLPLPANRADPLLGCAESSISLASKCGLAPAGPTRKRRKMVLIEISAEQTIVCALAGTFIGEPRSSCSRVIVLRPGPPGLALCLLSPHLTSPQIAHRFSGGPSPFFLCWAVIPLAPPPRQTRPREQAAPLNQHPPRRHLLRRPRRSPCPFVNG